MPPFHHPFLLPPLSLFCFHVEGNRRGNAACFRQLDPSINHVVESMASVRGSRVLPSPLIPPQLIEEYSDSLSACLALASLSLHPSNSLLSISLPERDLIIFPDQINFPFIGSDGIEWMGWFHRISRSRGGRNKGRDVFFFLNVKLVSKDDEITKSLHRSHRVNTAISSMNE